MPRRKDRQAQEQKRQTKDDARNPSVEPGRKLAPWKAIGSRSRSQKGSAMKRFYSTTKGGVLSPLPAEGGGWDAPRKASLLLHETMHGQHGGVVGTRGPAFPSGALATPQNCPRIEAITPTCLHSQRGVAQQRA